MPKTETQIARPRCQEKCKVYFANQGVGWVVETEGRGGVAAGVSYVSRRAVSWSHRR